LKRSGVEIIRAGTELRKLRGEHNKILNKTLATRTHYLSRLKEANKNTVQKTIYFSLSLFKHFHHIAKLAPTYLISFIKISHIPVRLTFMKKDNNTQA